jgi:hypothetical protein
VSASPSAAPAPQAVGQLACRLHPDRWFDRADRTHALAACLACPARSWCAREALSAKASWGMWAGIWIDGTLADVAHYLRAIAEDRPSATPPPAATVHRIDPPRLPVVIARPANHSVAAVITARSSGHCEILAPGCRLSLDAIASRIDCSQEPPDASGGYAVCRNCRVAVTGMEPRLRRRLGYTVDSLSATTSVPFCWRQSHWMRLDPAGGAAPWPPVEQIA